MIELIIIFQLFCSWILWRWSEDCFEDKRQGLGYAFLVASAANFASAMAAIF